MNRLKQIVETTNTRAGRFFNVGILLLILVSILCFSIETIPEISPNVREFLWFVECFAIGIFTLEYLTRLMVADNKWKFVTSFYGIVDLLAILPFFLSLGLDLVAIRSLRLLRVFRLFKVGRYNKAIQRYHKAFWLAKEELVLFLCVTLVLFYLSAVGIYYFENAAQPDKFSSVFDSMWWSVITLTTVGYGDVYPITIGGRVFTFVILLIGLGMVSLPSGIFAAALAKSRQMDAS